MNLETKKLNEVLGYEQPTKYIVETTDYKDSFATPVLTAGKSFLLGYTDDKAGIFTNVPAIIFDDFTTSFHYVDFPFKVKSSAMKILTPKEDFVDLKYVYQQMKQVRVDTQLHKRYWISIFSNKEIPFPKIDIQNKNSKTQKQIASILDNAAALRDKTKQLLKEYDLLAQSIFLEMFGDISNNIKFSKGCIGDLVTIVRDGPHVSPRYSNTGIPILSTRNIRPFKLLMEQVKYVSEEMFIELTKRFKPEKGDVLLTKGGTTGYSKVVDWDWDFCIWVHLAVLRVNKQKANPKYLEAALNSYYGYYQSQRYTRGIANKDLGLKRMVKIELPIPPINLQNQFAEKIALIEQQKALAKQELQESEDLFNCLLQKAFKGELV